jgi:hypothetical protein
MHTIRSRIRAYQILLGVDSEIGVSSNAYAEMVLVCRHFVPSERHVQFTTFLFVAKASSGIFVQT